MFYEIDVGKHNDKCIKRAAKDGTKLSEEKARITHWYVLSLFFSSPSLSRLPVTLAMGFKEYKTTLI